MLKNKKNVWGDDPDAPEEEKSRKENALDNIFDALNEAIMNEGVPIQEVQNAVKEQLKSYEDQARKMLEGLPDRPMLILETKKKPKRVASEPKKSHKKRVSDTVTITAIKNVAGRKKHVKLEFKVKKKQKPAKTAVKIKKRKYKKRKPKGIITQKRKKYKKREPKLEEVAESDQKSPRVTKSNRMQDIDSDLLKIVQQNPMCKMSVISSELDKKGIRHSREKIYNDLVRLAKEGFIVISGERAGTRYSSPNIIRGLIKDGRPLETEPALKAKDVENPETYHAEKKRIACGIILSSMEYNKPATTGDMGVALSKAGRDYSHTLILTFVKSLMAEGKLVSTGFKAATKYWLSGSIKSKEAPKPAKKPEIKPDVQTEEEPIDSSILEIIRKSQPISSASIHEEISESMSVSTARVSKEIKHLLIDEKIEKIGAGLGTRYTLPGFVPKEEEEDDEEIEEALSGNEEEEDTVPQTSFKEVLAKLPPKPEVKSRELDIIELCIFLKSKMGKDTNNTTQPEELEDFCEDSTDLWAQLVDSHSPLRKKIDEHLGFKLLIWETKAGMMVSAK